MPVVIDFILPYVTGFVLVLSRISGLFIMAPMLSSQAIPRQIKAALVLVMTLAVFPTVDLEHTAGLRPDLYELAPLMAGELLIGGTIGALALIPFMAVQLGGLLMGQQMGLAIADVLNPAIDIQGNSMGQMLFMMTLVGFVFVGGFELLFGGVVHSFAQVPPGAAGVGMAPIDVLVGMLASGYELAVRLSLPVVAVIFVESIVMGFIMKTVPTLNIMTFGFPIRIALGLIVFVSSLAAMKVLIDGGLLETIDVIERWVAGLVPAAPSASGAE